MKLRKLFYVGVLLIMNCNSFVFAQSKKDGFREKEYIITNDDDDKYIINGDTVFYQSGDTVFLKYGIPTIQVIKGDTIILDTIVNRCKHCDWSMWKYWDPYDAWYKRNGRKGDYGFPDEEEILSIDYDNKVRFQKKYLKCFGFSSFSEYSKFLSHNKTILIMEPTGRGTYEIRQCKINGVNVDLVLDTGAARVLISKELEEVLKANNALDPSDYFGEGTAKTAKGKMPVKSIIIKDFEIGGIHLKNIKAAISPINGTSVLLGQSVLSNLFAYTIMDDRFIILRDNPNYDLTKVVSLIKDIVSFFQCGYMWVCDFDELKNQCDNTIEKLLELERISELDALHLLYLATCYFEINEYEKCIRTCNRYIYTYSNHENSDKDVFKRMYAAILSLQLKSLYYNRATFNDIFSMLEKVEAFESIMDTSYYRDIKYFSAICKYYLGDYNASSQDLKQSIQDFQYCLSNNYGYRIEDSLFLAKMFYDFSLWSYAIGEKTHSDNFLRLSFCMNKDYHVKEMMQKHPDLYTGRFWPDFYRRDWYNSNNLLSRLEVFDLYLYAAKSGLSRPLVGSRFYKIKTGEEGWQYYYYDKKTKMIVFDE